MLESAFRGSQRIAILEFNCRIQNEVRTVPKQKQTSIHALYSMRFQKVLNIDLDAWEVGNSLIL